MFKRWNNLCLWSDEDLFPADAVAAEGPFAPLVLAEVEFPSEAEANAFQPPAWFDREVTYDPSYTNAALSRRKL